MAVAIVACCGAVVIACYELLFTCGELSARRGREVAPVSRLVPIPDDVLALHTTVLEALTVSLSGDDGVGIRLDRTISAPTLRNIGEVETD